MKCSKCGTENPQGKNVCLKCGAFLYSSNPRNRRPLTREERKMQMKSKVKGTTLGCLWTIGIILGLFIVLGAIVFVLVNFVLPEDFLQYLDPAYTTVTSFTSDPSGTVIETTLP